MKISKLVVLSALAATTPAAGQTNKPDPTIGEARAVVARSLKDPAAAQFQNVRSKNTVNLRGRPIQIVCGDVNAKNSYGAFTGFSPWIYFVEDKSAHVLGPDRDIATAAMLKSFCS